MEATIATATTSTMSAHVYYDVKGETIIGEVDIILVDETGTILAQTDATASFEGSLGHLLDIVDAQLRVFAGLETDVWGETLTMFRNFDGKTGRFVAVSVKEV